MVSGSIEGPELHGWTKVRWYQRQVLVDEPYPSREDVDYPKGEAPQPNEVWRPAGSVVIGVKAMAPNGECWGQVALVLPPITEQGVECAWKVLITLMNDLLK